jgi:hypothetical protein
MRSSEGPLPTLALVVLVFSDDLPESLRTVSGGAVLSPGDPVFFKGLVDIAAVSSTWMPSEAASMPWVVPLFKAIQSGKDVHGH